MKRRTFGTYAGVSMAALKFGYAKAQTSKDPSLLKTTLTPMGSERAGNADGSIPAWTGGYTTVPEGWQPGDFMPDPFANEQPVAVINASNMSQYVDKLSDGVMAMMTRYGFSIKVYPTHRSHALPQWIYDNIASNLNTAKLDPGGARLGFTNAYGGYPFPIPDVSDPFVAGAQIIYNHETRWVGSNNIQKNSGWVVNAGQPAFTQAAVTQYQYPYYDPSGSSATFQGMLWRQHNKLLGPANLTGEEIVEWNYTDPYTHPAQLWELLSGQGRVRRAPELMFDAPSQFADGLINYDEYSIFIQSLQEYDWKYLGKKELYIPYNNNELIGQPLEQTMKAQFLDPNVVRWELHRVWIVEANVHQGERNVLVRRRFYVDEDCWTVAVGDAYDANGNLFHVAFNYFYLRPDLPGLAYLKNQTTNNLQANGYVVADGVWGEKGDPSVKFNVSMSPSVFDPENMAASAQY